VKWLPCFDNDATIPPLVTNHVDLILALKRSLRSAGCMSQHFAPALSVLCVLSALASGAQAQSLYVGGLGGYATTNNKQNDLEPLGLTI
jgi:hypothetical protein